MEELAWQGESITADTSTFSLSCSRARQQGGAREGSVLRRVVGFTWQSLVVVGYRGALCESSPEVAPC